VLVDVLDVDVAVELELEEAADVAPVVPSLALLHPKAPVTATTTAPKNLSLSLPFIIASPRPLLLRRPTRAR
jgi:hypothetical protein